MAKTKKNKTVYFDKESELAIIQYNNLPAGRERDIIFSKHIYPALDKLVENIIHTWKFHRYDTTYEDMKMDTITFLLEKLDKYTEDRGKAYSFFTIIAKNYLIQRNVKLYRQEKENFELDVVDTERNIQLEVSRDSYVQSLKDFISRWTFITNDRIECIFDNNRDRAIAYAVLELFNSVDFIDDFNKKKLYILIREQTGIKTQYITNVVKVLKDNFFEEYAIYQKLDNNADLI